MQWFFQEDMAGDLFVLDQQESKHISKVLRKPIGELVHFTNGKGSLFTCKIEDNNPKKTQLRIIEQQFFPKGEFDIHLAIAPTKNMDRIEWLMEKITEIGVDEITILQTENTERIQVNLSRLQKKAINACKQSRKVWLPTLNDITPFGEFIQDSAFNNHQKFICFVDEKIPGHLFHMAQPGHSYLVLIGPEGDFGPTEIQTALKEGFLACSLGKSRLRTETAGLVAVHSLQLANFAL
ncbi:RsmE family RNA methyltransferase [Pleomorphovibrio marinus]|uniref:RsmE family RNA methyltransferase n=1 Tax=Pleomorphovibrio marinus TaxID=2164132 RepID=UPI000E0C574E|nr:RsmE family RNA methyltransferase [Pleomorphovibrio marinus]